MDALDSMHPAELFLLRPWFECVRPATRKREDNTDYQILLTHYASERLFYRLSLSAHRDRFILKGALLFVTWIADPFRPTRDLDLLGYGDSSPETLARTFRDICSTSVLDDGVHFDTERLTASPIREDLEYGGVRRHHQKKLGSVYAYRHELESWQTVRSEPRALGRKTIQALPETTDHLPDSGHRQQVEEQGPAFHARMIGLYYWKQRTRTDLMKAVGYYQEALLLDSERADAYAGLADTYVSLFYNHQMPPRRAMEAAKRAIDLGLALAPAPSTCGTQRSTFVQIVRGSGKPRRSSVKELWNLGALMRVRCLSMPA